MPISGRCRSCFASTPSPKRTWTAWRIPPTPPNSAAPKGRLFVLPTFRGARTLQEYQSAFGPGGSLPSDYSISPQVSYFAPVGAFTFGGSASLSRVGNTTLTATPDYEPGIAGAQSAVFVPDQRQFQRHVLLRRPGGGTALRRQQFRRGAGYAEGNRFHLQRDHRSPWDPGRLTEERSLSTSDISQTRLTAGFSRDLSRNVKVGVFYRYAFIRADDHDVSHTINDLPLGLNATRTAGHSSEFGLRLRGMATPRLSYGFAAAWLGISLLDGMNRIDTVDSHERDRAQRGSTAIGVGYALTQRTTLSFDLAGGNARTWASAH